MLIAGTILGRVPIGVLTVGNAVAVGIGGVIIDSIAVEIDKITAVPVAGLRSGDAGIYEDHADRQH